MDRLLRTIRAAFLGVAALLMSAGCANGADATPAVDARNIAFDPTDITVGG